jgi:hypothetical protein
MTNDARRVGRSRMGWFGFWVLCVPPPAIHASRPSSWSRRVILPWALPLSGLKGANRRVTRRARTGGREWSAAFRRSPGAGLTRSASAHGLCVSSVGLATDPVSNTEVRRLSSRSSASTVRGLLRDATRQPPSPLTSLQRVEATDALPILERRSVMSRVRRGPAPCLRFCTVRERSVLRPSR